VKSVDVGADLKVGPYAADRYCGAGFVAFRAGAVAIRRTTEDAPAVRCRDRGSATFIDSGFFAHAGDAHGFADLQRVLAPPLTEQRVRRTASTLLTVLRTLSSTWV
jgi:hypothetical protein